MNATPSAPLALHLGLAAIGPGMLTLPYGLSNTGVICGALILLASYLVSILSCLAIYDAACFAAKRDRTPPARKVILYRPVLSASYGYLVNQLLDKQWSFILDLALVISGFGGAVSFLIFLGDFVPVALQAMLPVDSLFQIMTQRTPVILVASVLCTILSTTDNGVSHPVLSAIPIAGSVGCLLALAYRLIYAENESSLLNDWGRLWSLHWDRKGFPSINLFLFAFMMQPNVLPTFAAVSPLPPCDALALSLLESPQLHSKRVDCQVESDSKDALIQLPPPTLKEPCTYNRRLGTLSRTTLVRSLLTAHSVTLFYYSTLAAFGVMLIMRTGQKIPQNLTRGLPSDDVVYVWLRIVLILCLLVLSPYLFSAVANGCMNLVAILRNRPLIQVGFGSFRNRLAYSFGLVSASAIIALSTDRVAAVLTVLGGWGATVLMCTFPAVLYCKIAHETGYICLQHKLIITFCVITSIVRFGRDTLWGSVT